MRKIGLAVVTLALIAGAAFAQGAFNVDWNIMGTGARARGMGGAFIGVADDATAIGWNPAGVAQLEKMEASAVGLFNMRTSTFEATYGGVTDKSTEKVTHIAPAFASFIFPLKVSEKNLVMGIAYQRLIDFGYGLTQTGTYTWGTRWSSKQKETGGLDAISPTIAFQLSPMFSLGAAGNIIINGTKTTEDRSYPDYSSSYRKASQENKFSGFNLNAGALISTQKFNLGAMIRLPFNLKEKVSGSESWDLTAAGMTYYGTATGSFDYTPVTYETSMPLMFGFGIAVKPTDKFTLSADFERRNYSSAETKYTFGGVEYTDTLGWHDCNQIRVGMEYVITGNNMVFPIRLGFRTDPKVYGGAKGSFTDPDTGQATGVVFTGGFGMNMGRVMLDLAYEYGSITPWDLSDATDKEIYTQKSHNIMASCIFHF